MIVHVSLFSFFRWRFRWNGNTPEGWGGGGYFLRRAYWGRAASQGMFFGIFVLNRVSNLSFFCLNQGIDLSIFVLNRMSFLGR